MHSEQDLAPGQGVQLDEVEGGNEELKENPASSRNPKDGLPNVSAHGLHDRCKALLRTQTQHQFCLLAIVSLLQFMADRTWLPNAKMFCVDSQMPMHASIRTLPKRIYTMFMVTTCK